MKSLNARVTFATMTAVALAGFATSEAQADDVSAEIRLLRARLNGLEPLKERLKRLEAQVAKQNRQRKQAKTQNGETGDKPASGDQAVAKSAPFPFFADLSHGLTIESLDHASSLRIGGRVLFDGGISSQPEQGSRAQSEHADSI